MALTRESALFYWSAEYGIAPVVGGDPVFSRDSAGTFRDRQRTGRELIRGLPRFPWEQVGEVVRPVLQLELARENKCLWSEGFDNAAWVTSSVTVTANAKLDPSGGNTADVIDDFHGSVVGRVYQNIGIPNDSTPYAFSTFLAKGSSAYAEIQIELLGGTTQITYAAVVNLNTGDVVARSGLTAPLMEVEAYGDGYYRVSVGGPNNGTGNTTCRCSIHPAWNTSFSASPLAEATGTVHAWGAQLEAGAFQTAYIKTEGSGVARAVDQFYFGGAPPPQAMAVYSRGVLGAPNSAVGGFWQIGAGDSTAPRLVLYQSTSLRFFFQNSSGSTEAVITFAAGIGDEVEMLGILNADGSLKIILSVNGADVTSATAAAPTGGMPSDWSARRWWMNATGTGGVNAGRYADLRAVKLTDLVASTDQGRMDELRDYVLDPAGNLI
jgi:hypothetical protein